MCVEGSQNSAFSELQVSRRKESAKDVLFKQQMTNNVGIEKWSKNKGLERAIVDFFTVEILQISLLSSFTSNE